ncbi:MAG TPA: SGNH/GDSL hydrolase family protein [Mycobacteriales bacterium]|nr:SGNH/GDSL hydrolase family protein [Mycobacteriales bacterium]
MTAAPPTTRADLALLVPEQRRPPLQAPVGAPVRRRVSAALLLVASLLGAVPASPPPAPAPVRAYFLGDSLMSGTGSEPRRPVLARVAARELGWDVEVDAWGGTGFTTTGRSPGYLERLRLPGALAGRYDVVLVEGGTNDARVGSPPDAVRAAVHEVVAEVRRRQPQARVVLVGAYDPPGVHDLRRAVADAAVRDAARDLGLPFTSPLSGRWHADQDPAVFLSPDGLHPDEDGYAVLGARLAQDLAALLPARAR